MSLVVKLLDQANQLMRAARWAEARELLLEHETECERSVELAWTLGWTLFKLGQLEDARVWLEKSVALGPASPVTHYGLGALLQEMDDDAAEDALARSLELGDGTTARYSLALFLMERERYAEAEAVHLEGLRLRPQSRERMAGYADFLSDVGREDEASAMYAKAESTKE